MSTISLKEQVKKDLEKYFSTLEKQEVSGVYQMVISQVEEALIYSVLKENDFNQTKAASMLGINRNTLRKKIKQYSLLKSLKKDG